jgi:intracellular multiplication protein IcmP
VAGGGQQIDPMVTWGVLIAMLVASILGMWLVGHDKIGPAIIQMKRAELYPLTYISRDAYNDHRKLDIMLRQISIKARTNKSGLSAKEMWGQVVESGRITGKHYRYPIGVLLIVFAGWIILTSKQERFRNDYGLEGLLAVQAKTWPIITPFIKYNPAKEKARAPGAKVPQHLPMFSEALYPEEWMALHRIRVINGVPDRDQIRRALLIQLGPRFEGVDALPDYLYCLLAAIALRGTRKRAPSDAFLGELAKCWTPESGFVPTAQVKAHAAKILNDPKVVEPLSNVLSRHGFVTTAMMAALAWARREGGVLPPAAFVWLRGEDRTIWYPLNNVGRRAFHTEAAGAVAHYQAEVSAGRALLLPRLDAAVVSIVQYLSDTRARIPELVLTGVKPAAGAAATAPPGRRDALAIKKG